MRSPARGAASRERILQAAAEVAAVFGYEGTTISRVTARSRLPASSVYWFFSDKDELMAEVVGHSFQQWLAEQPEWDAAPVGEPMEPVLRDLLRKAFGSIRDIPAFFRIGAMLTLESREVESRARQRYLRLHAQVTDRVAEWFADALRRRGLAHPETLAGDLARLAMTCLDGLFLSLRSGVDVDTDQFADLVLVMMEEAVTEGGAGG